MCMGYAAHAHMGKFQFAEPTHIIIGNPTCMRIAHTCWIAAGSHASMFGYTDIEAGVLASVSEFYSFQPRFSAGILSVHR